MSRDEPSHFSGVLLPRLGDVNAAPDSLPALSTLRLRLLKPVCDEGLKTHWVEALPLRGLGWVIYRPAAAFCSLCRDDDPHCWCCFMALGGSFHTRYSLSLQTRQIGMKNPILAEDQGINCPRQDTDPPDFNFPASSSCVTPPHTAELQTQHACLACWTLCPHHRPWELLGACQLALPGRRKSPQEDRAMAGALIEMMSWCSCGLTAAHDRADPEVAEDMCPDPK